MKIAELEVSKSYVIPLVVTAVTPRETKAKKPYLSLEFFDGVEAISGNYWDWPGVSMPTKNMILNVNANVNEYLGKKQLNIKGMTINTDAHISDFTPNSGVDIPEIYKQAYCLMSDVVDDDLRTLGLAALEELKHGWLTVPGAKGVHHAYAAGTLIHSLSVAVLAESIAYNTDGANKDLCVVGGMLHDIGKLFTYSVDGITIDMTDEGMAYDHLFIGAEFIGNFAERHLDVDNPRTAAKVQLLRHIILSHHGSLEHGAVVTPACIEAHIVFHADMVDAVSEMVRDSSKKAAEGSKWTERIWALDNKPHFATQYVEEVFIDTEE